MVGQVNIKNIDFENKFVENITKAKNLEKDFIKDFDSTLL